MTTRAPGARESEENKWGQLLREPREAHGAGGKTGPPPVLSVMSSTANFIVSGVLADGTPIVFGAVASDGTSHPAIHHVSSASQFQAESWDGEHAEHEHHEQEEAARRFSIYLEEGGAEKKADDEEDEPIASSAQFERTRSASLAAALLELDPRGVPLVQFFKLATNEPLLEVDEGEDEVEPSGAELVLSQLLFTLQALKMSGNDAKHSEAVQRLRELEEELRAAGAVTPADPAVSEAVARALAVAGAGRDVQIRVNQSKHTTTTKTVYETETSAMAHMDTDQIRNLHQQILSDITSGAEQHAGQDSGTTQKKETAEEGFTNEDGSVVVSKKMTRVVTTTRTTLPGEGEEPSAPDSPSETSLGSVKDRIARFEQLKDFHPDPSASGAPAPAPAAPTDVQEESHFQYEHKPEQHYVPKPDHSKVLEQVQVQVQLEDDENEEVHVEEEIARVVPDLDLHQDYEEESHLEPSVGIVITPHTPVPPEHPGEFLRDSPEVQQDAAEISEDDEEREPLELSEPEHVAHAELKDTREYSDEELTHELQPSEEHVSTAEIKDIKSYSPTSSDDESKHAVSPPVPQVRHVISPSVASESHEDDELAAHFVAESFEKQPDHGEVETIEQTPVYKGHHSPGQTSPIVSEHPIAQEYAESVTSHDEGDNLSLKSGHEPEIARHSVEAVREDDQEEEEGKLGDYAKKAGLIAGAVVAAPVALAAAGAKAAFDALTKSDNEEEEGHEEPEVLTTQTTIMESPVRHEDLPHAEHAEPAHHEVSETLTTVTREFYEDEPEPHFTETTTTTTVTREYKRSESSSSVKESEVPREFRESAPTPETPARESKEVSVSPSFSAPSPALEHEYVVTETTVTESVTRDFPADHGDGEEEAEPIKETTTTTTVTREYDDESEKEDEHLVKETTKTTTVTREFHESPAASPTPESGIDHVESPATSEKVQEDEPHYRETTTTTTVTREFHHDEELVQEHPAESVGSPVESEISIPQVVETTTTTTVTREFHDNEYERPESPASVKAVGSPVLSEKESEHQFVTETTTTTTTTREYFEEPEVPSSPAPSSHVESERPLESPAVSEKEIPHVVETTTTTTVTREYHDDDFERPESPVAASPAPSSHVESERPVAESPAVSEKHEEHHYGTEITTSVVQPDEPVVHRHDSPTQLHQQPEHRTPGSPDAADDDEESDGEGFGKKAGIVAGAVVAAPVALAAVGAKSAYDALRKSDDEEEGAVPEATTTSQWSSEYLDHGAEEHKVDAIHEEEPRTPADSEKSIPHVVETTTTTTVTREIHDDEYERPESPASVKVAGSPVPSDKESEHQFVTETTTTTTTSREYFEEPEVVSSPAPSSHVETERPLESPAVSEKEIPHVVETTTTTTVTREYHDDDFERPESPVAGSPAPSTHVESERPVAESPAVSEKHEEPHYTTKMTTTTTTTREYFEDEPREASFEAGGSPSPAQSEEHLVKETTTTTTVTREFQEDDEKPISETTTTVTSEVYDAPEHRYSPIGAEKDEPEESERLSEPAHSPVATPAESERSIQHVMDTTTATSEHVKEPTTTISMYREHDDFGYAPSESPVSVAEVVVSGSPAIPDEEGEHQFGVDTAAMIRREDFGQKDQDLDVELTTSSPAPSSHAESDQPDSSAVSEKEVPHVFETTTTTTVTREYFEERQESPSRSVKDASIPASPAPSAHVESERPLESPAVSEKEIPHVVETTTTTTVTREYHDDDFERPESPVATSPAPSSHVESERPVAESPATSEKHEVPHYTTETTTTTTTTRGYFEEEPLHREESPVVTEPVQELRQELDVPASPSGSEVPSEHSISRVVETTTTTVTREFHEDEPEYPAGQHREQFYHDEPEHNLPTERTPLTSEQHPDGSGDESDGEGFGSKVLGFAKKAGMVAGAVVAAPVALAAVGAKSAYDALKKSDDEEEPEEHEPLMRERRDLDYPVASEKDLTEEKPASESPIPPEPHHFTETTTTTTVTREYFDEPEEKIHSPAPSSHVKSDPPQSPATSEPEHHHVESATTTTVTRDYHEEDPRVEEHEFEEHTHHPVETTTTVTRDVYEEAEGEEPAHHFVETTTTTTVTKEFSDDEEPEGVLGEPQEDVPHVVETMTTTKVTREYDEDEEKQFDSESHVTETTTTTTVTREFYGEQDVPESPVPSEDQGELEQQQPGDDLSSPASESVTSVTLEHREDEPHVVETITTTTVTREFHTDTEEASDDVELVKETTTTTTVTREFQEEPEVESPPSEKEDFGRESPVQHEQLHRTESPVVESQLYGQDQPIESERLSEPAHSPVGTPAESEKSIPHVVETTTTTTVTREIHDNEYERPESPASVKVAGSPVPSEKDLDHQFVTETTTTTTTTREYFEEPEVASSPSPSSHIESLESPDVSEKEIPHVVETTTTTTVTREYHDDDFERPESPVAASPAPSSHVESERPVAGSPVPSEKDSDHHFVTETTTTTTTTREYFEEPEVASSPSPSSHVESLESPDVSEKEIPHVVETTTTTTVTREYHDDDFERPESPVAASPAPSSHVESERPFAESPDISEKHEEPHYTTETTTTTTTTREYFEDERLHREESPVVAEPVQELRQEHDVPASPSGSEVPSEHSISRLVETTTTTVTREFHEDEPEYPAGQYHEQYRHDEPDHFMTTESAPLMSEQRPDKSGDESDGEGFGSKVLGFAKKAGMVAGAVVAAPVALAAVGAKSAYDALKKSDDEDEPEEQEQLLRHGRALDSPVDSEKNVPNQEESGRLSPMSSEPHHITESTTITTAIRQFDDEERSPVPSHKSEELKQFQDESSPPSFDQEKPVGEPKPELERQGSYSPGYSPKSPRASPVGSDDESRQTLETTTTTTVTHETLGETDEVQKTSSQAVEKADEDLVSPATSEEDIHEAVKTTTTTTVVTSEHTEPEHQEKRQPSPTPSEESVRRVVETTTTTTVTEERFVPSEDQPDDLASPVKSSYEQPTEYGRVDSHDAPASPAPSVESVDDRVPTAVTETATTTTREVYDTTDDDYPEHHVIETTTTTTVTREFHKDDEFDRPESPASVKPAGSPVPSEKDSDHHFVTETITTTTTTREHFEERSESPSRSVKDASNPASPAPSSHVESERPLESPAVSEKEIPHVVETTTTTTVTREYHDDDFERPESPVAASPAPSSHVESDRPVAESPAISEKHEVPHYTTETTTTTTTTRENFEEEQLHREESPVVAEPVQELRQEHDVPASPSGSEVPSEHSISRVVETTTTTVTREFHEYEPEYPAGQHHEQYRHDEPEHFLSTESAPPMSEQHPEGSGDESDGEGLGSKVLGLAKKAGMVAGAVVAAPVALAAVGAKSAYDALRKSDDEEEPEEHEALLGESSERKALDSPIASEKDVVDREQELARESPVPSESFDPTHRSSVASEGHHFTETTTTTTVTREYFDDELEPVPQGQHRELESGSPSSEKEIPHVVETTTTTTVTREYHEDDEDAPAQPEEIVDHQEIETTTTDSREVYETAQGDEPEHHYIETTTTTTVTKEVFQPEDEDDLAISPSQYEEPIVVESTTAVTRESFSEQEGIRPPSGSEADDEGHAPKYLETTTTTTVTREYEVSEDDEDHERAESPEFVTRVQEKTTTETQEHFEPEEHVVESQDYTSGSPAPSEEAIVVKTTTTTTTVTHEHFEPEDDGQLGDDERRASPALSEESAQRVVETTTTTTSTTEERFEPEDVIESQEYPSGSPALSEREGTAPTLPAVTREHFEPEHVIESEQYATSGSRQRSPLASPSHEAFGQQVPSEHSVMETSTTAATREYQEEEPDHSIPTERAPLMSGQRQEESGDESDGEGFGSKVLGFAKKAGMVAGAVVAAPVALAAVGAKSAYDALKKSDDEEEPEEQEKLLSSERIDDETQEPGATFYEPEEEDHVIESEEYSRSSSTKDEPKIISPSHSVDDGETESAYIIESEQYEQAVHEEPRISSPVHSDSGDAVHAIHDDVEEDTPKAEPADQEDAPYVIDSEEYEFVGREEPRIASPVHEEDGVIESESYRQEQNYNEREQDPTIVESEEYSRSPSDSGSERRPFEESTATTVISVHHEPAAIPEPEVDEEYDYEQDDKSIIDSKDYEGHTTVTSVEAVEPRDVRSGSPTIVTTVSSEHLEKAHEEDPSVIESQVYTGSPTPSEDSVRRVEEATTTTTVTREYFEPEDQEDIIDSQEYQSGSPVPSDEGAQRVIETTTTTTVTSEHYEPEEPHVVESREYSPVPSEKSERHVETTTTTTVTREHVDADELPASPVEEATRVIETTTTTTKTIEPANESYVMESEDYGSGSPESERQVVETITTTTVTQERYDPEDPSDEYGQEERSHGYIKTTTTTTTTSSFEPEEKMLPPTEQAPVLGEHQEGSGDESDGEGFGSKVLGFAKKAGMVAGAVVAAPVALAAVGAKSAYDALQKSDDEEEPEHHGYPYEETKVKTTSELEGPTIHTESHQDSESEGSFVDHGEQPEGLSLQSTEAAFKLSREDIAEQTAEKLVSEVFQPLDRTLIESEQYRASIESLNRPSPIEKKKSVDDLATEAFQNVTKVSYGHADEGDDYKDQPDEEDEEWKVYDRHGEVLEEFSTQLTDDVIHEAKGDATSQLLMRHEQEQQQEVSPRRSTFLKQESCQEISNEPEVDYYSDLQEKLNILAGEKSNLGALVEEEPPSTASDQLDVIHESDNEHEEHVEEPELQNLEHEQEPSVEELEHTAVHLVGEVLDQVVQEVSDEEHDDQKTMTSDAYLTATSEGDGKDDQYDTCVTSQDDTYESAQGWTSQDSEYTTATSQPPSRLSDSDGEHTARDERQETSTPQAMLSPVDSDRQFTVQQDYDMPVLPAIRAFDPDDFLQSTARSTPDVALQVTIEEEDESDDKLPISPSGVLLPPASDPGRPVSPVPPRRAAAEGGVFDFPEDTIVEPTPPPVPAHEVEKTEQQRDEQEPERIHGVAMEASSDPANSESSRYSRQLSDLSSSAETESHAETVIRVEGERSGSSDSLEVVSVISGGKSSTPEKEHEEEERVVTQEQTIGAGARVEEKHQEEGESAEQLGFEVYDADTEESQQIPIEELETVEEEPEDSDSLNEGNGSGHSSVGVPADTLAMIGKYRHQSSDNLSLTSLQEFERLEKEVGARGDGSLTRSEIELLVAGRLNKSGEGSVSSLAEFERLEKEMTDNQSPPEDVMMLSDIREESEAEDMSIRDDDEEEAIGSDTELRSRPVQEEDLRGVTPVAPSPTDSLEHQIDPVQLQYLETSTDSLEPTFQEIEVEQRVDSAEDTSLAEYEMVPRVMEASTTDSLDGGVAGTEKDSVLEGASQGIESTQSTHGMLSGDTMGTVVTDDDDKDSLDGEVSSMLQSYPTTLTTFQTTVVAPDGSVQTISRRVETRVTDPLISHVTFTGTESQERLDQLPDEEQFETVDTEGNVTRTTFRRDHEQQHQY